MPPPTRRGGLALSVCAGLVPAQGRGDNPQAPEGVLSAAAEQRQLPMPAIDNCISEDGEGPNHRTLPIPPAEAYARDVVVVTAVIVPGAKFSSLLHSWEGGRETRGSPKVQTQGCLPKQADTQLLATVTITADSK